MDSIKDSDHDELYFTITEVSRQIGVVPATIRNWEKQGVFMPKRKANGYRVFTMADIELLKNIKRSSKDESMGINAIRMLYASSGHNTKPQSKGTGTQVSKKLLSQKWREFRIKRGYLLEDVAKEIGISSSYLSKIENGHANVSYETLDRLACFYGQNILYYVGETEDNRLIQKSTGEVFSIGLEGVSLESLVGIKNHTISAMLYSVEPGCGRFSPRSHSGDEFAYVLNGRIKISVDDSEYILKSGDAISFHSKDVHLWHNCGQTTAKILWMYTPMAIE